MIVVTFALRTESSGLIKNLREKQAHDRDGIVRGKIGTKAVGIFHTGVGSESCRTKIRRLLTALQPEVVISSGFAGSVSEQFRTGDLLLAENFSDQTLLEMSRRLLASHQARLARLFTVSKIVDLAQERNEIARAHGAVAIDMETEVIAAACASSNVPMISLRVITDTLAEPLPAPPDVLFDIQRQRTDGTKLAAYLLRHPQAVGRLLQFSRRINRARATLTEALVALTQGL